jgi:hypothetical protein
MEKIFNIILALFWKKNEKKVLEKTEQIQEKPILVEKVEEKAEEKQMKFTRITLHDYFTSSGRYPERDLSPEKTQTVINNAKELILRVNLLLAHLKITTPVSITSGFRPSSVNGKIANAATRSAHQSGEALDLLDNKNQTLCKAINRDLLEQFDLYREDSDFTQGKNTNWCHLQTRKTASGKRIFKP